MCYLSLLIFRTLQYTSTREIPTHSYLKLEQKKYPFQAEATPPHIVHYRKNTPPPPLIISRSESATVMYNTNLRSC